MSMIISQKSDAPPSLRQQFETAVEKGLDPKAFALATSIRERVIFYSEPILVRGALQGFRNQSIKNTHADYESLRQRVARTDKILGILRDPH